MHDIDSLFEQLNQLRLNNKRPPVHLWHPEVQGHIDIEIDAQGRWFHGGRVFTRQALVKLFAQILRRENDGYYLVTPVEKLRITVADVPFMVTDFEVSGVGALTELLFTTNVEEYVLANEVNYLTMKGDVPYLHVRDQLFGKLTRSAFYRLVDHALQGDTPLSQEEESESLMVYSQGAAFNLGSVS